MTSDVGASSADHFGVDGRTRVVGILNVTPDSFSDGGRYLDLDSAVAHGRNLAAQGAVIIDVGGESTRPGAEPVGTDEEQRRVLPVIAALTDAGISVSVDTIRAATARAAVAEGAVLVNDVSGGQHDPTMLRTVAELGVGYIAMHWRGIPDASHRRSHYSDVVDEVADELARIAREALDAGIAPDRLVLDPGLGFDKTARQGWELLAGLPRLAELGYPVLIGASRKRMIAETLAAAHDLPTAEISMEDRDIATAVVSALAAGAGVWGVRVHEVASTVNALAVAEAWRASEAPAWRASEATDGGRPPSVILRPRSGSQDLTASEGEILRLRPSASAQDDGIRPSASAQDDGIRPSASSQDRVTLTGLEVFAHHGVFDFERERGQRFVIDVEVSLDLHPAASGDALEATVHYGELAAAVVAAVERDPVDLIETVAERVADLALGFPGVAETRVTVHKPDAPIDADFADVSVTVVRRPPAAHAAPEDPA